MLSVLLISICAISSNRAQSFDSPATDWVDRHESGAYQFGYSTGDEGKHYHVASASANNMVTGRFGFKDPETGLDLQTTYTAGRKGFRARGPHIARRMDLSQNRPPFSRPNNDGKYIPELDNVFDPNEDRGYDFSYRTPTQVKEEHADRNGDVQGRYSYVDDVAERHTVEYIAGSGTGFTVTNAVPDSFARARGGPLYFVGKKPGKIRGFHAIQKALDGSYRFEASGPDHKRSEVSDSMGNRRGTYTYLDDKGIQHTVEYIAGPNIGYKVINNKKGTAYNPVLPYFPDVPTSGPFSPSFPPTTFRPVIPPSTFGVSGGKGGSGSASAGVPSSFPVKPSEPTKFPVSPTGSTPTKFPVGPTVSVPLFPSADDSPSQNRPEGLPDSSYAFPSSSVSSTTPTLPVSSSPSPSIPPKPTSSPQKPTTLFTPLAGSNHKWDYDGFKNPIFPHDKDWSKPEPGKKPRPGAGVGFPFFKPSYEEKEFGFFDEGLNTAESGRPRPDCSANGTSPCGGPKTHYRGSVKFGGVRRSGDDKEKREEYFEIPPGIAVRAHVQSLDIVPFNKRFAFPSEALEAFGKAKGCRS